MSSQLSKYLFTLISSLGLAACGGSDLDPTSDLPTYKNINIQMYHFANLNDQASELDDAIDLSVSYTDAELGKTETSLYQGHVYGWSSLTSFLFPDTQNKDQFTFDFELRDGNSQLLLAELSPNLFLEPAQLIFAQGPYADNRYRLNRIDRPDLLDYADGSISLVVMNLTSFTNPQPVDLYLNGAGYTSALQPEVLSDDIVSDPNTLQTLTLKQSGTETVVASCTFNTEDQDWLVVFTPDSKCRLIEFLEPKI